MEPLRPEQLCSRCDPAQFAFETTAELEDLDELVGQPRVAASFDFGVEMAHEGYNLFAVGPEGIGKRFVTRRLLEQAAGRRPPPSDWCYVNNFEHPHKPKCLRLPAGRGLGLKRDMEQLIADLRSALNAAFESDEYKTRRQVLDDEFNEKPKQAFSKLNEHAREKGFAMLRTPVGVVFAPLRNDEVIPPDEFDKLSDEEKERLREGTAELEAEFRELIQHVPDWERERSLRLRELNREVTGVPVHSLVSELRGRYEELEEVCDYLTEIEKHVGENAREFLSAETQKPEAMSIPVPESLSSGSALRQYQVNVLVDHDGLDHAPVVFEDHPTYAKLLGRVEHLSQMGTLVTDFRLIRAGALHRANGGFLILDARALLMQPYAWDALKRALRSKQIVIEALAQSLGLVSTVSLEPAAIPLDVKVVLLGNRRLYYLLSALEPDFRELFKVVVDFDDSMERSQEISQSYARIVATIARREELRAFDRGAVARLLDESSRMVGDGEKLSANMADVANLLRESDHAARMAESDVVTADHVEKAIADRVYRVDRIRERVQEQMVRETVLIDTEGEVEGQINALSVLQLAGFRFGRPTRITTQVRLGKGRVIDIEREVELGGPLHSKGVLILSGYLGGRYGAERPLAISASIVFEQSYGMIYGDSASAAELFTLLSALARAPIAQRFAVTGSVNQRGQIQAIGGVSEKIEGFFDLCKSRGLTGDQAVVIPSANVVHLTLRSDVVDAVREGKFAVYAIDTVEQGIELLTGVSMEDIDKRIDERLTTLEERLKERDDKDKEG